MRPKFGERGAAGPVTLLGAVLLIVGTPLLWLVATAAKGKKKSGAKGVGYHGLALTSGKVALIAGVVVLLAALGMWLASRPPRRRILAAIALVAAVAATSVTVYGLWGPAAEVRAKGKAKSRSISTSPRIGGYLDLAGGIIAIAGTLMGLGLAEPAVPSAGTPTPPSATAPPMPPFAAGTPAAPQAPSPAYPPAPPPPPSESPPGSPVAVGRRLGEESPT
jgi:hypothetical protein